MLGAHTPAALPSHRTNPLLTRDGPLFRTIYLYVSDTQDKQVYRYNISTGVQDTTWKLSKTLPNNPQGIVWYSEKLYVADILAGGKGKIRVYDSNGIYLNDFEKQTDPSGPEGIGFSSHGDLFVAQITGEINRYYGPGAGANAGNDEPAEGKTGATFYSDVTDQFFGITWDAQGPPANMFVADASHGNRILEFANTGTTPSTLVGNLAGSPFGVSFSGAGPLYFSLTGKAHEVDQYNFLNGMTTTFASKELQNPEGLIWATGGLYVADHSQTKIVQYKPDGSVGSDPWTKVNTPVFETIN